MDNFRKSHFGGLVIWRLPQPHCTLRNLLNAIARDGWGLVILLFFWSLSAMGVEKRSVGECATKKMINFAPTIKIHI